MSTTAVTLSSLSHHTTTAPTSTSTTTTTPRLSLLKPTTKLPFSFSLSPKSPFLYLFSSHPKIITTITRANSSDIDTSFFDNVNPEEEVVFDPPTQPEDYIPPPSFDEGPMETEEEIAAAYEELYGPAYSGVSFLGKDIYVMDSKVKKN
jgi:small subunit ribosomal protein S5